MPRSLKSALTLAVLIVTVAVGGVWAWGAFTEPFPERSGPKPCTEAQLSAGESLTPEKVIVSVYNASDRSGLAGDTADRLQAQGFPVDEAADAPAGTTVRVVEIWVDDPQSPVAQLVRSYFGKRARLVQHEPEGLGVNIVVGPRFRGVVPGRKSIELTDDLTVCVPNETA